MKKILFLLIFTFVAAGCSKSDQQPVPLISLVGGTWTYTEITVVTTPLSGQAATTSTAPGNYQYTLTFHDNGNVDRIVGSTPATLAYTYLNPTLTIKTTPVFEVYTVTELKANRLIFTYMSEDPSNKY